LKVQEISHWLEAQERTEANSVSLRADLDRLFSPLVEAKAILLAVSGGPDSTALMLLATAWAKESGVPLHVATVDHRLRPESRQEAEAVAAAAARHGLSHQILNWEGEKPKTRLQERARDARYHLLCAYAQEIGANYLATAHHADDQAETILFRLLRGSGLDGLAGMAAFSQRGALIHARPLLGLRKADLIAICEQADEPFVRDPSNENPAFARTRLRRLTEIFRKEGLDHAALLRLGARAARAEVALMQEAQRLAQSLAATRSPDLFTADISALADAPEEILRRLLAGEIQSLRESRARFSPLRLDRLEQLAARLATALMVREALSATLGGMLIGLTPAGRLTIRPETRRRRGNAS
jgi:tRNA(Ile)-lysidine synthase